MKHAFWLILILNILDIVITVLAIRAGASEGNPLAKFLIDTHLIYPLKVAIPGFLIYQIYRIKNPEDVGEIDARRAWCVAGFYILVVVFNVLTWIAHVVG